MYLNRIVVLLVILSCYNLSAQFVIKDNFRNKSTSSVIRFGGSPIAELTAGKFDPDGDGWLRITPAVANSRGFSYIDQAFSSTLGVIAEFEFKAWRTTQNNTYTGGDGFSVFLFDGSINSSDFRLGGYGSSLGYARNTATTPSVNNGLKGGYIGIGFDSYGNYGNNGEGKGGMLADNTSIPKDTNNTDGTIPNTIVLRGATDENTPTLSNRILAYAKLGDRTGTGSQMRLRSELDYDELSAVRPNDNLFYRKIKIVLKPVAGSTTKYRIQVFMNRILNTGYSNTPLIDYTTEQAIPQTLKIGFAASTGGAYNNHEIRNLQVTTTGNLSVFNTIDVPISCSELQTQNVTFRIDVNNLNSVAMKSIDVESKFLDKVGGNVLKENEFKINSINYSSNISNSTIENTLNTLKGSISLPAESSGTIFVNGTIRKPNIQVVNTVNVSSTELIDQDLSNNTSTEIAKRYQCKVTTNPMIYIKSK